MLERAKGCLEHNGRRLFRLRSDGVKPQRLHYAFWSHGATDIETPAWWTDLLSRTTQEEEEKTMSIAETTREYLKAGFNGGHFLDFLYPDNTRRLMRKLVRRDAALRLAHGNSYRQASTMSSFASHSTPEYHAEVLTAADRVPTQSFDVPATAHTSEEQSSKSPQCTSATPVGRHKHSANLEEQLEKLYRRVKIYRARLQDYEKTFRAIELVDKKMQRKISVKEAVKVAQELDHAVDAVVSLSESMVLDYLHNKRGVDTWTPHDWTISIRIHLRRGSLLSSRFLRSFDWALSEGKASTLLFTVFREVSRAENGLSPQVYSAVHHLRLRYDAWRESAPLKIQNGAKPFWQHALRTNTDPRTDVEELLDLFMHVGQHMKPKRKQDSGGAALAATALDLADVIIRHISFQELDDQIVLHFFQRLLEVLRRGPASYVSMTELLSTILFQNLRGHKGLYANLHAVKIVDALAIHGGYKGEGAGGGPDLERKLFFNLTRLDLPVEAKKLMRKLQRRRMDRVQDYERLRFQLAKTGDSEGLRREGDHFTDSQERLRANDPEQFERHKTPTLQLYKDRLEAHRRSGELSAMLEVFNELQNDPKAVPDYFVYCQLISGHARLNDTDGADSIFQQMVAAGIAPGVEAYAPILQALARMGDIYTITALTNSMEHVGIEINDWIVNAHVYAYLQRGQHKAAEALIFKALTFKMEDRTKMWNYVLLDWALKGNRKRVNFLMDRMRRNRIPFDSFTFAARIQMWVVLGHPDIAWQSLKKAMPQLGLRALPFHYALVIRGFAHDKTRFPFEKDGRRLRRKREAVQAVYKHMLSMGLHPDWNVRVAMSEAAHQQFRIASPRQAKRYLTKLLAEIDQKDMFTGPLLMSKNVGDQYEVFSTGLFDFMFKLSRQKSHLARFDSIWKLYVDFISRTSSKPFSPPVRILHRLMMLFRKQKAWTEARRCWQSISEKVDGLAKSKNGYLLSARRSLLAGPLHGYLLCLREQGAPLEDIKSVITSVLKRGYTLDNRCWNLYIRILCTAGIENHLLALETAEEQLVHKVGSYPRILGGPHTTALKLGIMRRFLESKEPSFHLDRMDHYPFRLKTSLGTGLPLGYLDSELSTVMTPLKVDAADDEVTWNSAKDQLRRGPAVDLQSFEKSDEQRQLDMKFAADGDPRWQQSTNGAERTSRGSLPETGLTAVTAMIEEGSLMRRPEYSTLVYLAGVYLALRKRLAFDPHGAELVEEIHAKCSKTVAMILMLPRTNDKIQRDWVRTT